MGYERERWHSGLTYEQTCEQCNSNIRYTDYNLDYRPWYPDGFIECPHCKKAIRHHEKYAINEATPRQFDITNGANQSEEAPSSNPTAKFCSACGHKFLDEDRFCSICGKKRM